MYNIKIKNINFKTEPDIEFDNNGQVKKAQLAENTEIDGIIYKADNWIEFDEYGKVKVGVKI